MLSSRGTKSLESMDIPWRFAPGGSNPYDAKTNPSGTISFGLAENSLIQKELQEYVNKNVKLEEAAFTYRYSTMGGTRFSIAMASHINDYFNPHIPIEPKEILTASGLTSIHEMVGWSLADPGEGILVSRPIYGRFELDFGNTDGLNIIYADMKGTDPFAPDVLERYQEAFDQSMRKGFKVKAVLIVNPHNPLGRCYSKETLEKLMKFAQKNNLHLISDEVYALSVYDTGFEQTVPFTSVLSLNPEGLIDTDWLHVFYGLSKDFGPGIRLGSLITKNTALQKSITANFRFHNPSGMSIAVGTAILEDKSFVAEFTALSRKRLAENYRHTRTTLEKAGIFCHKGGNAGFFLYIDLSPWLQAESPESADLREQEYALAQRLLDGGVGLHPCEEHGEEPGHFRLVFSQPREVLDEGLRRLIDTLGKPTTAKNCMI